MKSAHSKQVASNNAGNEGIEWELRPGGMLVQKRDEVVGSRPMIKVKVSHGSYQHEVNVPAQATFVHDQFWYEGELKRILAQEAGLKPQEQRLLYRGKEKDNDEFLHMAGVKDMSKVVLLEDPASKERKLEQMKGDQGMAKAYEAVSHVRAEISALESSVHGGKKIAEKEFAVLTEFLMVQLLKLDSIEAEGEAKVQRRIEVRRVQSFLETIDTLKARKGNPFSGSSSAVSVTTQWETFESGLGSLNAPRPMSSSKEATNNWELFN
ncbi:BAG family molecular chaperone regulator 4 isoform X2 [Typha angustifolia]|uniref:BAG family molecular chaperone regulator 4 isoform X2 n=1 Tax=Typha angustifolia TaxID=59011 RepID=UPI003C2DB490